MSVILVRAGRPAIACFIVVVAAAALLAQGAQEEQARELLQSGRQLLIAQNSADGLATLRMIVTRFPKALVADDALLEIARYELEVLHDVKAASSAADTLLAQYADSDSAPGAEVIRVRAAFASSPTTEQLTRSTADLDRLARLHTGSGVAADALFHAADMERTSGSPAASLARFNDLVSRFPREPIAARALLSGSSLLVSLGQAPRAVEQLQRLRNQFMGTPEAETALAWLTILHRLYLKGSGQPIYTYSSSIGGPAGKFSDFRDLVITRGNRLLVATRAGLGEMEATGQRVRFASHPDIRTMFLDARGSPLTVHDQGSVRGEGRQPIVFATARGNGRVEPLDIDAAVTMSAGDVIVASRSQRTLFRFSGQGGPKGEFAGGVAARRLAISNGDDVAALDTDQRSVVVLSREGRVIGGVAEKGSAYQLRQPADVSFDELGHLYVLERTRVLVFTHLGDRLLATFAPLERTAGSLSNGEALALDAAARLYVFDGGSGMVQVYR